MAYNARRFVPNMTGNTRQSARAAGYGSQFAVITEVDQPSMT